MFQASGSFSIVFCQEFTVQVRFLSSFARGVKAKVRFLLYFVKGF